MNDRALLEVESLSVTFPSRRGAGEVRAVEEVSFQVPAGTTVGLVGESGSGKTTIGRTLLRLQRATSGAVRYAGQEILSMSEAAFQPLRRKIQMIFQDPYGSLNPRLSIFEIVSEPLEIHFPKLKRSEREARVAQLLKDVGLPPEAMARR
jgi:oligopeptide transport system ATP-binding protein